MRTTPLQILTWGPITTAVVSAAWLSSTDQGAFFCSVGYRATSRALGIEIPQRVDPAHPVGASGLRGVGEAKQLQASAG